MDIVTIDGLNAILDEEHWEKHIVAGHPELRSWRDRVIGALSQPDGVYRSKRDDKTRIYVKVYAQVEVSGILQERIALMVSVRESNGFVVTAHLAGAMLRGLGEQIWPL